MTDEQRQQYLDSIKEFCLMDDTFMSTVFADNIECTELMLHIILNRQDLKVQSVTTQHELKNLQGRSIRLDIHAIDADGKEYDIEVQRDDNGALPQRARYNSSLLDAQLLGTGEYFDKLPETYIIFITENDVLGANKPAYHIERTIKETDGSFCDGSHIIYVNGAMRTGDTPLAMLMHDFFCNNPADMNYKQLSERTRYYKESDKGVSEMCKIMENLTAAAKAEGEAKGRAETLKNLVKKGLISISVAAKEAGMTEEAFKKIACL